MCTRILNVPIFYEIFKTLKRFRKTPGMLKFKRCIFYIVVIMEKIKLNRYVICIPTLIHSRTDNLKNVIRTRFYSSYPCQKLNDFVFLSFCFCVDDNSTVTYFHRIQRRIVQVTAYQYLEQFYFYFFLGLVSTLIYMCARTRGSIRND